MAGPINETARWAKSLSDWLHRDSIAGLRSTDATSQITHSTIRWARRQSRWRHWTVVTEAEALTTRRSRSGRAYGGRVDLLFERPGGRPAIAVEIDRGNKQWSLTKLAAEVDAGNIALWVRWKGDTIIPVSASIGLVDIRATRITAE